MASQPSIPFLVPPSGERERHRIQVTHEIILVHGFGSGPDASSHHTKCRNLLESWVIRETAQIRLRVNVRVFALDGSDILRGGPNALMKASFGLYNAILATSKVRSSPLFCAPGQTRLPSRAAVFVAHGLGTWVVKGALSLLYQNNRSLDPAGLVFVDVPETQGEQTPVDEYTDEALWRYLRELSEVFRLPSEGRELRPKLEEVDGHFRALTGARYGVCELYKADPHHRNKWSLFLWCGFIWMSEHRMLEFEKSGIKRFFRRIADFFSGHNKRMRMELQLQGLHRLKLEESLMESITADCLHDLEGAGIEDTGPEDTGPGDTGPEYTDPAPQYPPHIGEDRGGMEGRQDSPRTPPGPPSFTNPPPGLPGLPEDREAPYYLFNDHDFIKAISLRDGANPWTPEGRATLIQAQNLLEDVLSKQSQVLGLQHPRTARTACALVTTSLLAGTWCGRAEEQWTRHDLFTMESIVTTASLCLEEEGRKRFDPEVLDALFLLLNVRLQIWEDAASDSAQEDPGHANRVRYWTRVLEVRDSLRDKLGSSACAGPERLMDTLRFKYKVAKIFTKRGLETQMMTELLAETDRLVLTVAEEILDDLSALRAKISKRIEKMERHRRR